MQHNKLQRQQIMQTFPAQITKTTKISITRKPYNKFLQTENSQFIPPFKCYTQQKTHIVPNQKSHTQQKIKNKNHSDVIPIQMFF